jgi:hypothetical protein
VVAPEGRAFLLNGLTPQLVVAVPVVVATLEVAVVGRQLGHSATHRRLNQRRVINLPSNTRHIPTAAALLAHLMHLAQQK